MRTSDFDFRLPKELIAQEPVRVRSESRLLMVRRDDGSMADSRFERIVEYLRPGDVMVANQSRVIPARIHGVLETGGTVELLLVRELRAGEDGGQRWEVMARPARKLQLGVSVRFPDGVTGRVEAVLPEGRRAVTFSGTGAVEAWLRSSGELPLPPYIKRYSGDAERYQTVYARKEGSIAAPTAGLHFTPDLLAAIQERGVEVHFVTLHVGPGTFKPVHTDAIEDISIEPEVGEVDAGVARVIADAHRDGRRVVAVGTTTTRLLEGSFAATGGFHPWSGPIDLFIHPPFEFRVVDALITNFHLPRSTLLMLVSAFAGSDLVRRAYEHAVAERYRFYSFGDAMFIQ